MPSSPSPLCELPGAIGEVARRGYAGAMTLLVHEWGGTKRHIPRCPAPGQPLVEIVGLDAARVLAELRGGESVDIPTEAALRQTVKGAILRSEGTTREVAEALKCSERFVRMARADGGVVMRPRRRSRPKDEAQFDLEEFLKR